jgi:hypothetical protein
MDEPERPPVDDQISSPDGHIGRGQFIALILKRAALAGAILSAPKIIDKFLIPPAWAFGSSCNTADTTQYHDVQVLNTNSTIMPTDNDYSYATLTGAEGTYCVVAIGGGKPVTQY